MARTLCLVAAYEGTDFHGWQNQPGLRTVQGVMEDTLRRVLRHPVVLHGCSRTDSGVHASGHVSHFLTTCPLDEQRMKQAIESRLPPDLALVDLREVHDGFHARRSATSKCYRYRLHNVPHRPVEDRTRRFVHHFWKPLDMERMRSAARYFIGEMDFSSMAAAGTQRQSMVRTILRLDIERHLDEIRIDIEGTGFLYKQVRTIAGTLVNVGTGKWAPDHVVEILRSRDRSQAGPTLPAQGLCLQWVRYAPQAMSAPGHVEVGPKPADLT